VGGLGLARSAQPPMPRLHFAGLVIDSDASALQADVFAPALPLTLSSARESSTSAALAPADLVLHAVLTAAPTPNPEQLSALPALYHGRTRCFRDGADVVLWDGASTLRVLADGSRIEAQVHASSLDEAFHFSSVTVSMALMLALRSHGLFHLHAAGLQWARDDAWVIAGESGAGKSTLTLALLGAGASSLGDDALLLRSAGTQLEVVGLPRMLRMTTATAAAYPELQPLFVACPEGSARQLEIDPREAFPDRSVEATTEAHTLVFPRIGDAGACRVVELDRADALGRLLHSAAWVAVENIPQRGEQLALLTQLANGARAFDVAVSTRILTNPSSVAAELRERLR